MSEVRSRARYTARQSGARLLLLAVAFLDFVDASIVNVALPSIRTDLGFSLRNLQWVLSGYLLTYGGLMLLGGRARDLFGRRRLLVGGTVLFACSSLAVGPRPNDTRRDPGPHDPGRRRGDDDPGRAVHPHHDLQRPSDRYKAHGRVGRRRRARLRCRRLPRRRHHRSHRLALGLLRQPSRPPP